MTETVPPEAESRLTGSRAVAHLATCRDGDPHVAPLWFRYVGKLAEPDAASAGDDRPVVEVMTSGQKLANVRANPRVAVSIQEDEGGHPAWRVVLRGTATVVEDDAANRAANRAINRKYGADDPDDWLGENTLVRVRVGSASVETF